MNNTEWITDRTPSLDDCKGVNGTFYEEYVWTMVAGTVQTDYYYHIRPGIAWQPIVIEKPEPYQERLMQKEYNGTN